jgi:hypothetical protein
MALKIGKYVAAPSRQPAIMIFFRPIRSESQPKKMKSPVPSMSATARMVYAVFQSIFSVPIRKNSA